MAEPQSGSADTNTGAGVGESGAAVYAALDLGTNNCRMLVARPFRAGFEVIDSFSRIVRLGEGLEAADTLSDTAISRTLTALDVCAARMRERGVTRMRNVATEACRRAVNGIDFVKRVKAEIGLDLEPISAVEEGRLTLSGCAPLLDPTRSRALVFDIGGGSTEVMWVDTLPGRPPRTLDIVSLPKGVVTLAERHGRGHLPPAAYEDLVAETCEQLRAFDERHRIADDVAAGRVFMLGTSGTVTTLGGICLGLPRYDRSRVDGLDLAFADVEAASRHLRTQSTAERADNPCIGPDRAELVVAGCAVLEGVCRRWPVGRLRVADRGIREGILIDLMASDSALDAGATA